jgi:hypothetical protein
MQSLKEFWLSIRKTATPLIAIESHDEIATSRLLTQYANEEVFRQQSIPAPVWVWDCAQGYVAGNTVSTSVEQGLTGIEQIEDALVEVGQVERIPIRSVLIYFY